MRRHRSVLSRLERLKLLLAKGTWTETQSPLGLPKVRNLKIKMKKEKAAAAEGAEGAAAVPGAAAPAGVKSPAGGAKSAAGAGVKAPPAAAAPKADAAKKKA